MRFPKLAILFAASVVLFSTFASAQVTVDKDLPDYRRVPGISGSIKSVGSDTMNNLMQEWLQGFKTMYPSVRFEVEGQGSSKAMPALISGTASFGPMSRDAKDSEINDFEKKFGYKPIQLPTSIDMLAVFVSRDNPIEKLSLPQIDAIFSSTRKLGAAQPISTWGQLGLTGDWESAQVTPVGRNAASGTYAYFKEIALGNGDYSNSVGEQPGSSAVIQVVGANKRAIGYSGIGQKTADVKAVAIAKDEQSDAIAAEAEKAYSGKYPLSRFLLLTVNYRPGTQLDPLRREFIKYVFSKQGQASVVKDGYFPVPAVVAQKALASVGIKP